MPDLPVTFFKAKKKECIDQGDYNIMRKSVHKLGSFTTVLAAAVKVVKKPQALIVHLLFFIRNSVKYRLVGFLAIFA